MCKTQPSESRVPKLKYTRLTELTFSLRGREDLHSNTPDLELKLSFHMTENQAINHMIDRDQKRNTDRQKENDIWGLCKYITRNNVSHERKSTLPLHTVTVKINERVKRVSQELICDDVKLFSPSGNKMYCHFRVTEFN